MEDAVDALKMAFSVFVFVIALAIVFAMFSQAREVSDIVISKTDTTYFAEYVNPNDSENRTVGIESIIPTLYTYSKGKTSIEIVSNENEKNELKELFDVEIERKYSIRATENAGQENEKKYDDNGIYNGWYKDEYGIEYKDLYPDRVHWLGATQNNEDFRKRISAFIGSTNIDINGYQIKYGDRGRGLNKLRDKTFEEKFIERNDYSGIRYTFEDGSIIDRAKGTTKLYVTYTYT